MSISIRRREQLHIPEPPMEPREVAEVEDVCWCGDEAEAHCGDCGAGICGECGGRCECSVRFCADCLASFDGMKLCGRCLGVAIREELAKAEKKDKKAEAV